MASWALCLSLWARNPAICGYADTLLRMLLFWSMFLPLGARASLDARRRGGPRDAGPVVSLAGAAMMLQVAFVYFFTAMQRTGSDWRSDFSAIH